TVFPDPDSPTIPSTSPAVTVSERLSTACTRPSSVLKETLRSRTSSSGVAKSDNTHPRIEPRVQEVDQRIRDDDEERRVHDGCHDQRKVEVLERVVRQLSDPVKAEHDLGEQSGSTDQGAEIEAEKAEVGDQRHSEGVADEPAPFREPL